MRGFCLALLAVACVGCGGGEHTRGSDTPGSDTPQSHIPSPSGISTDVDSGDIVLLWDSVPGVDGYHVYMATEPNIDPINYAAFSGGTWFQDVQSPYVLTGLDPEPVYHFVVTAFTDEGESDGSEEVTAISRYEPVEDGSIVRDLVNELDWRRCSYGQTWDNETSRCDGEAISVTVDEARDLGSDGWRLPAIEELSSLVYCSGGSPYFPDLRIVDVRGGEHTSCNDAIAYSQPTILASAFPDTETAIYHSTTPAYVDGDSNWHYALDFSKGYPMEISDFADVPRVRLVRPTP